MTSTGPPFGNQYTMNDGGANEIMQSSNPLSRIANDAVRTVANYNPVNQQHTGMYTTTQTTRGSGLSADQYINGQSTMPAFGGSTVTTRQSEVYQTSSGQAAERSRAERTQVTSYTTTQQQSSPSPVMYTTSQTTQMMEPVYTNTAATNYYQTQNVNTTTTTNSAGARGSATASGAIPATLVPLSAMRTQTQTQTQTQAAASSIAGGSVAGRSETSSVVRREMGEQRLISTTERVDESRSQVLNEREVTRTIMVPRKIITEEVIEKTIVVPETIRREEVIDEERLIKEKIIEVTQPIIRTKIIEVPEIEYIEQAQAQTVEVIERQVPVEEIKRVPRYVEVEQPREHIQKVVYGPPPPPEVIRREEIRNKVTDVHRNLPIPVQSEVTYEFKQPNIKPVHEKIAFQVYIPRFVEVPVVAELLTAQQKKIAFDQIAEVQSLTKIAASLCEVEATATRVINVDLPGQVQQVDLKSSLIEAWRSNKLGVSAA